jgi:hypothetical protein
VAQGFPSVQRRAGNSGCRRVRKSELVSAHRSPSEELGSRHSSPASPETRDPGLDNPDEAPGVVEETFAPGERS